MNILTPIGFLTVGGVLLVLVGILGYVGIIGPTSQQSLFGTFWWFDNAENAADTFMGIVALLAAFFLHDVSLQKWLVATIGTLGIMVALYNLMGDNTMLLGANLESPADLLLHAVLGAWALSAAFGSIAKKAK